MRFTLAVLVALLMVGCAKSPQQVPFQAQGSTGVVKGDGASIILVIEDVRSSDVLGSRGGVYEATSLISLEDDAIDKIEAYLKDSLQKAGFTFDAHVEANWKVELNTLSYGIEKVNSVKDKITVQSKMSVEIIRGTSTFENSYSAASSEEVIGMASEAKNVEIINRTLNATLQAILNDDEINQFMN